MTGELIVEPVVTKEKLLALLAVGTELQQLDFKQKVDLDSRADLIELVKDIAALESCSGYLVIGADDHGRPTGLLTEVLAKKFDEANLRQKVEKYLKAPELRVARHTHEELPLVLIYVDRHPIGFAVVSGLGDYEHKSESKVVFRPGDVFVRRGTSSQRWSDDDVERLLKPRDQRLKELHRSDFAAIAAELQAGRRGESIASGPASALTWQLDQSTFEATVTETLRHDDMVPIRLLLVRALGEAISFAQQGDHASFDTVIDRLTSLAAIALTVSHGQLTQDVLSGLGDRYRSPAFRYRSIGSVPSYWLSILTRATALGGLAVHLRKWPLVQRIALEPSPDDHYGSWLRHGLTEAARANAFPRVGNDDEYGGLITPARRITHALPALRPYMPEDETYDANPGSAPSDLDPILDNLCGFDALASLIYTTESSPERVASYYPSFGFYYARRSEHYWARLLSDAQFREALMPNVSTESLEDAMLRVSDDTSKVHRNRIGPWDPTTTEVEAAIRAARGRQFDREQARRS
jgi:Putative DNA-binding domain